LFDRHGLDDLVKKYMHTINHITLSNFVDIIYLNGLIQHPQMKSVAKLSQDTLELLLNNLVDSYLDPGSNIYDYSNKIYFSWESIANDKFNEMPLHIENAKKAVTRSNIIIIIGYSFPLYNRIVDSFILNAETLGNKQLILQDPNAEDLKKIIKSDFGINETATYMGEVATSIKTIINCNSFFVPNNIFIPVVPLSEI